MNEFGRIATNKRGIISIKELPTYWKMKIEKWKCPYCGPNKLLKKKNETDGEYRECIKCGRAYQ